MRKLLVTLVLLLAAASAFAQRDPVSQSWNQPVEPFKIIGNVFYVGASDITSYLIATPKGHILIDGGYEETAPIIKANVEKLGFKFHDIRILLNSHAHLDHAGGLAAIKAETGARFMASEEDTPLLTRGGLGDPQFGDKYPFPAIKPDQSVIDFDRVALGGSILTARITPGHTRGCTTWTMTIREKGKAHNLVFFCSPSVPSEYRLVGNEAYPTAVADYRKQFEILKALPCDVPLASHGAFFDLSGKRERMAESEKNVFVDPEGCKRFVTGMEERFESVVKTQSENASR